MGVGVADLQLAGKWERVCRWACSAWPTPGPSKPSLTPVFTHLSVTSSSCISRTASSWGSTSGSTARPSSVTPLHARGSAFAGMGWQDHNAGPIEARDERKVPIPKMLSMLRGYSPTQAHLQPLSDREVSAVSGASCRSELSVTREPQLSTKDRARSCGRERGKEAPAF